MSNVFSYHIYNRQGYQKKTEDIWKTVERVPF